MQVTLGARACTDGLQGQLRTLETVACIPGASQELDGPGRIGSTCLQAQWLNHFAAENKPSEGNTVRHGQRRSSLAYFSTTLGVTLSRASASASAVAAAACQFLLNLLNFGKLIPDGLLLLLLPSSAVCAQADRRACQGGHGPHHSLQAPNRPTDHGTQDTAGE